MINRLSYRLIEFFRRHSAAGQPLALVTVLGTEGSTYSKAGGQMMVAANGDFLGMLSGGCLESDLAERAGKIMSGTNAEVVTYDLRDDDELFGLGIGCEGLIRILIQPLTDSRDYQPFTALLQQLEKKPCVDFVLGDAQQDFGSVRVWAPPRLLILGAGADVDPLARICVDLGFELVVTDHRPAAIERIHAIPGLSASCLAAGAIGSQIDLRRFDAAIVMSHNLVADREYLHALANSPVPYVGLLGPPRRRDRLLTELGADADLFEGRLHGPVGKRIGGRGPGAVALEIAAELQARFSTPA